METIKSNLWKLRGKTKEYIDENAPQVLGMVRDSEEAAHEKQSFNKPGAKGQGRTKKLRIHELQNELENTWCC